MRSILLKDYLEQRMYFLIILAVAVVSLLVAAFFKQLDPGIALVLLFGLQGPFFVYLAANHQISSEVNNRTFPFLISLPISRARLWLAKLLFVTIYTLLLYAFYIVLSLICGESWNEFSKLFWNSPTVVLGIPLLIISYGYFTSMLPRGFATFSALIILPVGFAIGLNSLTISTLNFELGLVLLIPMFLVISALIFMRDRAMNSPWRGFKGIALLVAGIVLLLTCWTAINAAAERFWTICEYSSGWVPLNGGRQILWGGESMTQWWDVLNSHRCDSSSRVILQDLETNEVKQIGSRMSSFYNYENVANAGFVSIRSSRYTAGFLRGLDETILDHDGNPIIALPSPSSENMKYFCLIDEKRFIYTEHVKNGQNVITEFSLYEKERGSKVVFSAQSDFKFIKFIVMPAKESGKSANVYISGSSEREPGKILLVSAVDGSKHVLSVSPESDSVAVCSDYIVYEEGVWNKERKDIDRTLILAYLDGRTERLDWLSERFEIVAVTATGKLLALKFSSGEKERFMYYKHSLVEIDLTDKSVKELLQFPEPSSVTVMPSQNREKALLYFNTSYSSMMTCKSMSVDLLTGQLSEFTSLNSVKTSSREGLALNHAFSLGGSRFMVEAGHSIYELDVASMSVLKRGNLESLFYRAVEGGGKS